MRTTPVLLSTMIALLASTTLASTTLATEWVYQPAKGIDVTASTAAPTQVLEQIRDAAGLRGVDLVHFSTIPAAFGDAHVVRYKQVHLGLPVMGTSVAALLDGRGDVTAVSTQVFTELTVDGTPDLDGSKAIAAASEQSQNGFMPEAARQPSLAVSTEISGGRLVWVVDVQNNRGGDRYLVDAHTGELVRDYPIAIKADGIVYRRNPVRTPQTSVVELTDLDPTFGVQHLNGWDGKFAVTNYALTNTRTGQVHVTQDVVPSERDDFLYPPPLDPHDASDAFAQVSVYYHLTRMRHYFAAEIGLDMTADSWGLVAVSNMLERPRGASEDVPMDNAFFAPGGLDIPGFSAPNTIAIGQGEGVDFAVDSDVFLHEFTHYVTGNAIGYNDQPQVLTTYGANTFAAAVDEGVSDYFSGTVNGDALLAESALAIYGSVRDLSDKSRVCPQSVVGESHADGQIIGALGWTAREHFGLEIGDQLVWGGTSMMPSGGTLGDWARGVSATAAVLVADGVLTEADADAVERMISKHGLNECDLELPVYSGQPRQTKLAGLDLYRYYYGISCEEAKSEYGITEQAHFQFSAKPNPGDKGLRFKIRLAPEAPGALSWTVYGRQEGHVSYRWQRRQGLVIDEYDYTVENIDGEVGELVIDATSNPPFDPTKTYNIAITNQSCPNANAFIDVEHLDATAPVPDAEPSPVVETPAAAPEPAPAAAEPPTLIDPPADGERVASGTADDGCSTAGSQRGATPWTLALAAIAGVLLLRRRR